MSTRTITAPQYILLYITEPLSEVGRKNWTAYGIYDTEEAALTALLEMGDSIYEHARVAKVELPVITLPGDFETIAGKITYAEQTK